MAQTLRVARGVGRGLLARPGGGDTGILGEELDSQLRSQVLFLCVSPHRSCVAQLRGPTGCNWPATEWQLSCVFSTPLLRLRHTPDWLRQSAARVQPTCCKGSTAAAGRNCLVSSTLSTPAHDPHLRFSVSPASPDFFGRLGGGGGQAEDAVWGLVRWYCGDLTKAETATDPKGRLAVSTDMALLVGCALAFPHLPTRTSD